MLLWTATMNFATKEDPMGKELAFSITGEFVTKFAREQLYGQHDFKKSMDWLTGCLRSDELSDAEVTQMAMNILNGRARMVGTYPGDDYNYEEIKGKEDANDIAEAITKWHKEYATQWQQLEDLQRKFAFIQSYLEEESEYHMSEMQDRYYNEFDDELFPGVEIESKKTETASFGNSLLDSFMARMHDETEDDYGWLEPDGTFHPVEWSAHQDWAEKYVAEYMPDACRRINESSDITSIVHAYGDYLVSRGWILLHSPAQGRAQMTMDPAGRITKAQKEFLYEYFTKRNMTREANALYND